MHAFVYIEFNAKICSAYMEKHVRCVFVGKQVLFYFLVDILKVPIREFEENCSCRASSGFAAYYLHLFTMKCM